MGAGDESPLPFSMTVYHTLPIPAMVDALQNVSILLNVVQIVLLSYIVISIAKGRKERRNK